MLPDGVLSTVTHEAAFLPPRNRRRARLIDYEQGGIALQNTTEGLQYQTWWARADELTGAITLGAEHVAPSVVLTVPGIDDVALAFDLNMNLFLAWTESGGAARFRWYDPLLSDFTIVDLPSGSHSVRASLDDKRPHQNTAADIILTYLRAGVLYYRQLRDRFVTEYELRDDLEGYTLGQFGMNEHFRMQWELRHVGPLPPAPPAPVGTLLEVFDTAMFDGGQDDAAGLGVWLGAAGDAENWPGCEIEISRDGGSTWTFAATLTSAGVFGTITTELGVHPWAIPDEVHTVRAQLNSYGATLTGTDLAGMLNLANMAIIGDEQVNFATVSEQAPQVYDLSYLLRGRNGTESVAHTFGERFAMLTRERFVFYPLTVDDLGKEVRFRARTLGASTPSATRIITFAGRSQIERAPAYLAARREGDDVLVSWIGVGRVDFGAWAEHGAFFTGYQVTITDGVAPPIVVETVEQELVQDCYGLGTPLTVQVRQRNSLTGLGPPAEIVIP